MRGEQLADIVLRHGVHPNPRFMPVDLSVRNSDIFVTKGALKDLKPHQLERLRHRGNRLLVDPVDEDIAANKVGTFDTIIAASVIAAAEFSSAYPEIPVALVNHHVDPRVRALAISPPRDRFRPGYFGELFNAVRSPEIESFVDFHRVSTAEQDDSWLGNLTFYNFHYGVRARIATDRNKPFLKGFTAAACGAPILVQADEPEPREWLGDDYPFLMKGEVTEAAIMDGLHSAEEAFGGPEWNQALEVMRDVGERTSDQSIAAQFARALSLN